MSAVSEPPPSLDETPKESTVSKIRTSLAKKREGVSRIVEHSFLIEPAKPFDNGPLVTISNALVIIVAVLPALALRILEFPFFIVIDQ